MAKELCRGAAGGFALKSLLFMGGKLLTESVAALLVRLLDGSCDSCGLPWGVGGSLELERPWARRQASSRVAGERLQA